MDSQRWRRIEELFNAALACAPDERARLLDQAEPDIKRKVEQMLNQSGSYWASPRGRRFQRRR
jgi:hypothetical protein